MMASVTPYLIAILAVTVYSSLTLFSKAGIATIPPFIFIGISMAGLSLMAFAASLVFERGFSFGQLTGRDWLLLAGMSATNLVAFGLYLKAITVVPLAEYQMIYILSPVIVGFLSFLIFREPFKMQYWAGLAVMALGLWIALRK